MVLEALIKQRIAVSIVSAEVAHFMKCLQVLTPLELSLGQCEDLG